MNTVTLTLELTYTQATKVLAAVERICSPDSHTGATSPKVCPGDTLITVANTMLFGDPIESPRAEQLSQTVNNPMAAKSNKSININELDVIYGKTDRPSAGDVTTTSYGAHHTLKSIPVVTKPTGRSKTSMPSFGRSQAQVDAYAASEASRIEIADEEAMLKQERKEAKEMEKAEIAKDKARAQKEIDDIKSAVIEEPLPGVAAPLKKPWEL